MSINKVIFLIKESKEIEILPYVKSVNFTQIISLMDKKIKISLFLKTKKVQLYIKLLAEDENLTINDYFCIVGVGRGAKTFIDKRVAIYILSNISNEFKYYMINNLILGSDNIILNLDKVPNSSLREK